MPVAGIVLLGLAGVITTAVAFWYVDRHSIEEVTVTRGRVVACAFTIGLIITGSAVGMLDERLTGPHYPPCGAEDGGPVLPCQWDGELRDGRDGPYRQVIVYVPV